MTDDSSLVQMVKRRLDGAQLMCHLTARHQFNQKLLGGAETEVSRLLDEVEESAIALREASILFRAKAKVVSVSAALRACDRDIRAYQAELSELDRLIELNRLSRAES